MSWNEVRVTCDQCGHYVIKRWLPTEEDRAAEQRKHISPSSVRMIMRGNAEIQHDPMCPNWSPMQKWDREDMNPPIFGRMRCV